MNKVTWFLIILLVIIVAMMFLPKGVGASDGLPEGVYVFEVGDHTSVLSENDLECFCPCDECEVEVREKRSIKNTPGPRDVPTDEPKLTDDPPDPTAPPKPTEEPKPTKTEKPPKPEKTKKPKCNCGYGDGAEGCDPNPKCNQNRNSGNEEGEGKK